MKRVAVITSGGDAPGMNAAVRAAVRCGLDKNWEMFGIKGGYLGLLAGSMVPLGARDVGGIMQQGGTVLASSRCPEFRTEEGQSKALEVLRKHEIDALIVIGGNGSQKGASALSKKGFPIMGVASTIDNDLYGSDVTIGVDTALNIALEAIDRLKVTASSLKRTFILEVMGRDCGYLALMAGIAGGAEIIVIPEFKTDPEAIVAKINGVYNRGKPHALVVVAEGAEYNAEKLSKYFEDNNDRLGFEVRATILGHVQRGGAPTAYDRLLATRLGAAAVNELADNRHGLLMGSVQGKITATPLTEVVTNTKKLDLKLLELANILEK